MAQVMQLLGTLCVLLSLGVVAGDDCDAYVDTIGQWHNKQYCSVTFCCGTCNNRYCCLNPFDKLDEDQLMCSFNSVSEHIEKINSLFPKDPRPASSDGSFGSIIAVGITIFVVFIVTIILCFTCSCCCLYKMCRQSPQPIVTTTTTAIMIHPPYPQQQGVPQHYPAPAPYPGYQPVPVQHGHMYPGGMPAAPYQTQYPPPYPSQPGGPPGYQETIASGAGVPYPAAQPPYNPAFVDSPKQPY